MNRWMRRVAVWTVLLVWVANLAQAAELAITLTPNSGAMELPVVRPVQACDALLAAARSGVLTGTTSTPVTLQSAALQETLSGTFCMVRGTIAPAIHFVVSLPLERWTQRLIALGCGGLCGQANTAIPQAGTCVPALNGEFAVMANDLGSALEPGAPLGSFATQAQRRIDFAYRANHETTQVAKRLIQTYYGQAQRFAYFSGCSDGGREALMEAQRYPGDFDGISAGAPVINFQVQNSFYHAWVIAANRGADGQPVLLASKLPVLHQAVIRHCDALDGQTDGLLADPRMCHFNPDWVACPPHATDTAECLNADELAVVKRIYDGPHDAAGKAYWVGGPLPGSELQWDFIPQARSSGSMSAMLGAAMRRYMIYPQSPAPAALVDGFAFDDASFAKVTQLHSLNDATNPDLSAFAGHAGKLLMWHGWSDTSVSPMTSIAYYKAVQQQMGSAATDAFLRLFLLPGTGHCGGGDGFAQIDTLTPLMAWVERAEAPQQLLAAQVPDNAHGPRGGLPQSATAGGPAPLPKPLPVPDQTPLASRIILPFPISSLRNPQDEPATIDWHGSALFAPGFQKDYTVQGGALQVQ